jgi:peroxiredoxin
VKFLFVLTVCLAALCIGLSLRLASGRGVSVPQLGIDLNYPRHYVTQAMELETAAMKNRRVSEVTAGDELGRRVVVAGGQPQFLLFIKDGCPCSIDAQPLFNRLARQFDGKVQFLGVIDGDADKAKVYAEHYNCAFPVLADKNLAIAREFEAKGGLYSVLVARNGHIVKMWPGYSAEMLGEMNHLVAQEGEVKEVAFDPQYAPTVKTAGCAYPGDWAK